MMWGSFYMLLNYLLISSWYYHLNNKFVILYSTQNMWCQKSSDILLLTNLWQLFEMVTLWAAILHIISGSIVQGNYSNFFSTLQKYHSCIVCLFFCLILGSQKLNLYVSIYISPLSPVTVVQVVVKSRNITWGG